MERLHPEDSSNWIHSEGAFFTADGLPLYEQSWVSLSGPRSRLVIVHGIAEHSGRYASMAGQFAQRGHSVHTFDLRGHGRSGGEAVYATRFDDYVDDLDVFIKRVQRLKPELPLFFLGHSMGGAICMRYIQIKSPRINGLILSSPLISPGTSVPSWLISISGFIGNVFPHLPTRKIDHKQLSRDPEQWQLVASDPLHFRGRIPARTGSELVNVCRDLDRSLESFTGPLLIFHGTADTLTDPASSRRLYERVSSTDKTLRMYEGFYHETFNDLGGNRVVVETIDWLEARCPILHGERLPAT